MTSWEAIALVRAAFKLGAHEEAWAYGPESGPGEFVVGAAWLLPSWPAKVLEVEGRGPTWAAAVEDAKRRAPRIASALDTP